MMYFPVILFLVFAASTVNQPTAAYNILFIPVPGKSHVFAQAAIADELARRGHSVSLLVGQQFPLSDREMEGQHRVSVVRYSDSDPDSPFDYDEHHESVSMTVIDGRDFFGMAPLIRPITDAICRQITDGNEQLFVKLEAEKFDLAVVDQYVLMKCVYLIPHRLRIPWITTTLMVDLNLVRSPWLPSFVPLLVGSLTERMTFIERLTNLVNTIRFNSIYNEPPAAVFEKYQQYGRFESMDDLISRSRFWLLQIHDIALDYAKPMMPNMASVGGLTVKRSSGQLPENFQRFLDGAKRGAIIISFGTLIHTFPPEIVQKFAATFERFDDYRIIWRLNNKDYVKLPDNVMIAGWLPQNDILAHPSTKLFITHCGNNGQFEAVYHGVPMIGFPIRGDQAYNARRIQYRGYGLAMSLASFSVEELFRNMKTILDEPGYSHRVKRASEIFRSQPETPPERAAFWIEHICRFGGEHLSSASKDLSLYEFLMLDVLAFVLVSLCLVGYALLKLTKITFSIVLGNKKYKTA